MFGVVGKILIRQNVELIPYVYRTYRCSFHVQHYLPDISWYKKKCQLNESFIFFLAASVRRINNKTAIMKQQCASEKSVFLASLLRSSLPGRTQKMLWKAQTTRQSSVEGNLKGRKHKKHLNCHNSYLFAFQPQTLLLHVQQKLLLYA